MLTSLLLMESIEYACHQIWQVQQRRRGTATFMVYWSVLTIGPLLSGISMAAISRLFAMPMAEVLRELLVR